MARSHIDVRFVNPVLEALVNVLTTMANIQAEAGKPTLKQDCAAGGVVSGLIKLSSKQANGSVAVSFSEPVALEITRRMLRLEPETVDEMVRDLVGEITNMVAGGAKSTLEGSGYDFDMTLPAIITGDGHEIRHEIDAPTVLLPFATEAGEFYIEVCFR